MKMNRNPQPSRALMLGAPSGAVGAPMILWLLQVLGMPLPADPETASQVGAAIGAVVAAAFGWLTRGGRKGEAD